MPFTCDGIGTWYYGRKAELRYVGTCPFCRNTAQLTSYNTMLFFVIMHIPIIPLGRKHIIEECAHCRKHRVMDLSAWEKYQAEAVAAMERYRQRPADAASAREVLQHCVPGRDREHFLQYAPEIAENLAHDPDILIMLASAYDLFNFPKDTQRFLTAALILKDDDNVRAALAEALMRDGQGAQAEPYVDQLLASDHASRGALAGLLGQTYQVQGDHEKALHYFEQAEQAKPEFAQDPVFQRIKAASQRNLGTHTSIKPVEVERRYNRNKVARKVGLIGASVAFLVLAFYFASAYTLGGRQRVFLVNGLNHPYQVKVNDATYRVNPLEPFLIHVPQGRIRVEIVDDAAVFAPQEVTITTPLWNRPFNDTAFVINPDHGAILERSTIYYTPTTETPREPKDSFFTGKMFYSMNGIDFVFQTPPREMTMSNRKFIEKEVLNVMRIPKQISPMLILLHLQSQGEQASAIQNAIAHVQANDDVTHYFMFLESLPPQVIADSLAPLMDDYPINLPLHRAYQMAKFYLNQDMAAEYQKRLAAHPDDKGLLYLYARTRKNQESWLLIDKAATTPNPCPYAFYALANRALSRGQFDDADKYMRQATALLPRDIETAQLHIRTLKSRQDYAGLVTAAMEYEKAGIPISFFGFQAEMYAAVRQNSDTRAVLNHLEEYLKAAGMPEKSWRKEVNELVCRGEYISGRDRPWRSLSLENGKDDFEFSILNNKASIFDHNGNKPAQYRGGENAYSLGLGVLAAYLDNDPARWPRLYDRMVKSFGTTGDHAEWCDWLTGKSTPTREQLRQHDSLDFSTKVVTLVAMGIRRPEIRKDCFDLARELNFDRDFPYLTLENAMKKSE